MSIVNLKSLELTKDIKSQIEEIFFLSSARSKFKDENEKRLFFNKWTYDYLTFMPQYVFLYLNDKGQVLGQLSGCPDSHREELFKTIPYYDLFSDQFNEFLAHFHINCHPNYRGMGIGKSLVDWYCSAMKDEGVRGVHIVTSPDALNVSFYEKMQFLYKLKRQVKKRSFLFMGKKL